MQGASHSFATLGSSAQAVPVAKKLPQVESASEDLACVIDRLGDRVGVLADRLGPVLTQAAGLAREGGCQEPDYATPLAANLQDKARRLCHIESVVNDLLERLEV